METKRCTYCGEEKPLEAFSIKTGARRQSRCKACQKELFDSTYHKRHNLQSRYGMSVDEYEDLLARQNAACAICRAAPGARAMDVDHCHETGMVRGLLCRTCNQAIGLFDHDSVLLRAAALYLDTAEERQKALAKEVKELLRGLKQ